MLAKMHRLLAILPLLTSFSPPLQRCRRGRRAITPKAANEDLAALKVPQLKALLKERGLKLSGKKQELIDRLAALPVRQQSFISTCRVTRARSSPRTNPR